MTTLLLPLGTIVNTNAMKSIAAFQALADKLNLGIKIPPMLKELNPLFVKFNLGALTEKEFEGQLLETIEKNIPEAQKANLKEGWKEVWKKEWRDAWNAMCQFDDRAIKIVEIISARKDIHFKIYSDTNPTQFEFISACLAKFGIDPKNIHTTFSYGNAIDRLLLAIKQECEKDIQGKQCSIVIGNPDQIKEEFLRKIALEKKQLILKVVEKDLNVIALEEPNLTVEKFQGILTQIQPSQPMIFSSQAAPIVSNSLASLPVSNAASSIPAGNEVKESINMSLK